MIFFFRRLATSCQLFVNKKCSRFFLLHEFENDVVGTESLALVGQFLTALVKWGSKGLLCENQYSKSAANNGISVTQAWNNPDVSDLSPLDRSLHELGMLSAITDSRYQYVDELRRKRSCTMDSRTKRCAFHILQINSNFVGNISPCKLCTKRSSYRAKPYFTPVNRYIPFQSESISERTRTKSENSDTGNENVDVKDVESVALSSGLYKSKSMENISSHWSSRDFKMELDELKKGTEENTDVELVSSKIKCLNVSNK